MFRSIASTVFVTCTLNFVSHIFVICTAFVSNLLVAVAKAIDIPFNRYFLETFCVLMNCIASKQEFNFVIISMPRLVLTCVVIRATIVSFYVFFDVGILIL